MIRQPHYHRVPVTTATVVRSEVSSKRPTTSGVVDLTRGVRIINDEAKRHTVKAVIPCLNESRIIPRRRRYIMYPDGHNGNVNVPDIPIVRRSTNPYPRRVVQLRPAASCNLKIGRSSSLLDTSSAVCNDADVAIRSTVKRLVVLQREESITSSCHFDFPTVPASMSMGGEYIEEEEMNISVKNTPQLDADSLAGVANDYFLTMSETENMVKNYECSEPDCCYKGYSEAALSRHVYSIHLRNVDVIECSAPQSGKKGSLQTVKPASKPKGVKCSECDVMAYSRPLLLKHIESVHGIEAPLIMRTFDSREELQQWLVELRTTHAVEFVVSSGSKKWGFGLQVHYLTCSRSGDQKERPNKKNARPPRPSIKCGKNCMAYLKIKQNPVTSVLQIEGCLHHSGHMIDGSMIRLTPSELRRIEILMRLNDGYSQWESPQIPAIRGIIGNAGRFRLIPDDQLCYLLRKWMTEYQLGSGLLKKDLQSPERICLNFIDSKGVKEENDEFDFLQPSLILTDDFGEYDDDSPASPLPLSE